MTIELFIVIAALAAIVAAPVFRFATIDPLPGALIHLVCWDAYYAARSGWRGIGFCFNGVTMTVFPWTTPDWLIARYLRIMKRERERRERSPEGIEYKRQQEFRRQLAQKSLDAMVAGLKTRKAMTVVEAMEWLVAAQPFTDTVGVNRRAQEIQTEFERLGYFSNVNCDDAFIEANADNHGRWIVGQALHTNEACSIHPMIHVFKDRWSKKFTDYLAVN